MKIRLSPRFVIPGLLSIVLTYFGNPTNAQCISTTVRHGTSAANDNSAGTLAFSNPTNVFSSNNARGSATALAVLFSGSTQYLKVTGFGFSVPSYGSICGIVVEIEKRDGGFLSVGSGVRDESIRLVKGNVIVGNNLGHTSTNWPTSDVIATHGGTSEMWGLTHTPAEVNAADFGVAIAVRFNGLAALIPSAQIDDVRITVYYNPVLPTTLIYFNTTKKNNLVNLQWKTAGEEENEFIIVQRKKTGATNWSELARYNMHQQSDGKEYVFTDTLTESGNYHYRLEINNNNYQKTYSSIKSVRHLQEDQLLIYPNPSRDRIFIRHTSGNERILVTNLLQQEMNVILQRTGELESSADIHHLPPGMYFIRKGNQASSFYKP